MSVTTPVDKLKSILSAIHKLAAKDVLVGVPEEDIDRSEQDGDNNATIGYKMEYGSPQEHIPARPTLVPGVTAVQDQIATYFGNAAVSALNGDTNGVTKNLTKAGITASTSVKKMINSNIQPALSARTLAERRARGVTRTNTLVDTGQFRNSITYVLREK